MKVHKLIVLIVDHDDLGAEQAAQELEGGRFGNRCISPRVMLVETRAVDWSDGDHPLNSRPTQKAAFANLFADGSASP